jgi:hypothetical protein
VSKACQIYRINVARARQRLLPNLGPGRCRLPLPLHEPFRGVGLKHRTLRQLPPPLPAASQSLSRSCQKPKSTHSNPVSSRSWVSLSLSLSHGKENRAGGIAQRSSILVSLYRKGHWIEFSHLFCFVSLPLFAGESVFAVVYNCVLFFCSIVGEWEGKKVSYSTMDGGKNNRFFIFWFIFYSFPLTLLFTIGLSSTENKTQNRTHERTHTSC